VPGMNGCGAAAQVPTQCSRVTASGALGEAVIELARASSAMLAIDFDVAG